MKIFNKTSDLKNYIAPFLSQKKSIGFVPTMGALHQGHLSLMERSLAENKLTIVSIYVNPTQFNNPEDLEKYPRTLDKDTEIISKLNDAIILFAPETNEMYGNDVSSEKFDFQGIDRLMEGASRPGHFDGVGTIVKKLFEIVSPTNAYFGEKDFQQIQIVKCMVEQTKLPVNIVPCPIIREENGLAMSSRNQRLSPQMKENASFIYKSLLKAKEIFLNESIVAANAYIADLYANANDFQLEYFTIAEEKSLLTATEKFPDTHYRAFIVVYAEGVRLIDNLFLQ